MHCWTNELTAQLYVTGLVTRWAAVRSAPKLRVQSVTAQPCQPHECVLVGARSADGKAAAPQTPDKMSATQAWMFPWFKAVCKLGRCRHRLNLLFSACRCRCIVQGSAACAGSACEWPKDSLQRQDITQVQAACHVRCEVSSASSHPVSSVDTAQLHLQQQLAQGRHC